MYEDLGTYDLMKPVVEELLAEYNSKKKAMNLVFFDDAIEHLTRIHRILRLQQVGIRAAHTDVLTTWVACCSLPGQPSRMTDF